MAPGRRRIIAASFRMRPTAERMTELGRAGLPVGLALDYDEVLATWPQLFNDDDGVVVANPPFELVRYE